MSPAPTESAGAEDSPFGHRYRVEEVLLGQEQDELPLVYLEGLGEDSLVFYRPSDPDYEERLCDFQYVPAENQGGFWESQESTPSYRLLAEEGTVILEFLTDGTVTQRWKLSRVDSLTISGRDRRGGGLMGGFVGMPLWFPEGSYTGNADSLPAQNLNIIDSGTITFSFSEPVGEELTFTEEIHMGNSVTVTDITISARAPGVFTMDVERLASEEETYVIYRIPFETGEFLFRVWHEN